MLHRERMLFLFVCPDHNHFKDHPGSIEYKSAGYQLTAGDSFDGVIAICPDHDDGHGYMSTFLSFFSRRINPQEQKNTPSIIASQRVFIIYTVHNFLIIRRDALLYTNMAVLMTHSVFLDRIDLLLPRRVCFPLEKLEKIESVIISEIFFSFDF